jgi:hypothetical protein
MARYALLALSGLNSWGCGVIRIDLVFWWLKSSKALHDDLQGLAPILDFLIICGFCR